MASKKPSKAHRNPKAVSEAPEQSRPRNVGRSYSHQCGLRLIDKGYIKGRRWQHYHHLNVVDCWGIDPVCPKRAVVFLVWPPRKSRQR
jgi:hypothetical protein